jgi:S-adenosylmethionine synthetase
VAEPVSVYVNTFGTGTIEDGELAEKVRAVFPLTPRGIIDHLDLLRPIYEKTATYGHFGRPGFPWEKVDMVEVLRR